MLSGGPTTLTLDPDVDFTAGETCTVTVLAAGVTDQDGFDPPDTMAANPRLAAWVLAGAYLRRAECAAA